MLENGPFDHKFAIGIVLDISFKSYYSGERYIDIIKQMLIKFAVKLGINGGLFISPVEYIPTKQGDSVHNISIYDEMQPIKIDLLMKNAKEIVLFEDLETNKYVIFVTDRYKASDKYKLTKHIDDSCNFVLIGIGEKYDKSLQELGGTHIESPDLLQDELDRIIKL